MTDAELQAIRERWQLAFPLIQAAVQADPDIMRAVADVPTLLAEVDRLGQQVARLHEQAGSFATLLQAEREACALDAEWVPGPCDAPAVREAARRIAAVIRARNQIR